jgi:hypothetical protein
MDLQQKFRDYRYGSAARYVHILCGLSSMLLSGVSVTWIATPRDHGSIP